VKSTDVSAVLSGVLPGQYQMLAIWCAYSLLDSCCLDSLFDIEDGGSTFFRNAGGLVLGCKAR
jgi:hypothetical protein